VRTRVDARLLDEAERLRFRFACEDCVHFGPEEQRCSLGYRAEPRRVELERAPGPQPPRVDRFVELCKTYELG
jgi:hypothetical protein